MGLNQLDASVEIVHNIVYKPALQCFLRKKHLTLPVLLNQFLHGYPAVLANRTCEQVPCLVQELLLSRGTFLGCG